MGVGDFIGPLIFLGIAAYGVWAFVNKQFPFNIDTSGLLGGGTSPDLSGGMLPTDGTMGVSDPCAACCGGTATGAAGYVSYASKKSKKRSKHSSKKKSSSKHGNKGSSGGGGGFGGGSVGGGGGGTDPCAGCNCGGTGGGAAGGVWGQNPASGTPCDIPGQPCSPVGSLGGTSQWCKCLAAGAAVHAGVGNWGPPYGDYGAVGELISAPLFLSNYAKSSDYGAIGQLISRHGDAYRSFQGNYLESDRYHPVQYGYLGTVTNSRLNQLAGIQDITPTRNPLAEYVDRTVPVAVA